MNLYITWDVTPEIVDGWKTPNLYGILFVSGLMLGYFVIKRMYKKDRIQEKYLDRLVLYAVLATIIGARLGHVFFYGPYWDGINPDTGMFERGYLDHPLDILKVWEGGLASHGGAIAMLVALWLYSRNVVKLPMMWILDRISAPIAIAGCFIRLGNLVNSEIVGDPTNLPWGFLFVNGDFNDVPRHPTQLYEALAYTAIFIILMYMYWKRKSHQRQGLIFGTFLVLLFGARFFIEFVKLGQTARDSVYVLNTGQMLSIPFVLAGLYILWRALKKPANPVDISTLQAPTEAKS